MGIGFTEGLLIALIALFFFGGKKIPELGRTLGASIKGFKEGLKDDHNQTDKTKVEVEIVEEKKKKS